jgi:hypothetical protein
MVHLDRVSITLVVGDRRLYELLEELCLVEAFKVRLQEP